MNDLDAHGVDDGVFIAREFEKKLLFEVTRIDALAAELIESNRRSIVLPVVVERIDDGVERIVGIEALENCVIRAIDIRDFEDGGLLATHFEEFWVLLAFDPGQPAAIRTAPRIFSSGRFSRTAAGAARRHGFP